MKYGFKKVAIYLLCALLSCSVVSSAYVKSVHAMEWVGGALAFEEALKWLLATLGIVGGVGLTHDYWNAHAVEFEDYCTQQNITDAEVTEWQLKLCQGILDKGSACWSAFKEWASTLVFGGSDIGDNVISENGANYLVNFSLDLLRSKYGLKQTSNITGTFNCRSFAFFVGQYGQVKPIFFFEDGSFDTLSFDNNYFYLSKDGSGIYSYQFQNSPWINTDNTVINSIGDNGGRGSFSNSFYTVYSNGLGTIKEAIFFNVNSIDVTFPYTVLSLDTVSDSDFTAIRDNVTSLDIISDTASDTEDKEVAIPMPGVADSDNEASATAYDDIVNGINEGTIPIEQGVIDIQELLRVLVYDEDTDIVFPTPDGEEGKDKDEVIQENIDNEAFTLAGLENVFPFCVPWDLYAFLGILEAEPIAPKFDFPFRDPKTKVDKLYTVDLAVFDDVAVVVRYGFDLMFIFGLALLTRSLIGAGSSGGE